MSGPLDVEVTADVLIDGSLRYRLALDPQCVAVEVSRARGARITVEHVDGCGCGDLSARLRVAPARPIGDSRAIR